MKLSGILAAVAAVLLSLGRSLTGADYLPGRRSCRGLVTLVNLSGYQWGIETAETGINGETFEVDYHPEFKTFNLSHAGSKQGFAVGDVEAAIRFEGEVKGSDGWMAGTFTAALTCANDTNLFGLTVGGVYLDGAVETQNREGLRRIAFTASKNRGIA